MKNTVILSAAALVATVAAFGLLSGRSSDAVAAVGAEMKPAHAQTIDLVAMRGVAYYTVEADGYRVVATLAGEAGALPVRFVATLGQDQKIDISVPRGPGEQPVAAEIVRVGDKVYVSNPKLTQ